MTTNNFNSANYWIERYKKGGNSGNGSYNFLAEYKAEIINEFIKTNKINSLIEYGVGDGNQISLIKCNDITGLDISPTVIDKCKKLMPNNKFYLMNDIVELEQADLVLSLDVIYHLIEDEVYDTYMFQLSQMSSKYIIIYAPDYDDNSFAAHVKVRKFTDNIYLTINGFELIETIPNKYPSTDHKIGSFSNWSIFKKKEIGNV